MSSARRRFIISYIFLVGVPLAGIAGILRAGKGMVAPTSVNGVWKLVADADRLIPGPCGEAVMASKTSLTISQSGNFFTLAFDGATEAQGEGAIQGTALKASMLLAQNSSGTGCTAAQPLTLTATVDPTSDPRSLAGVISADSCPGCAPISFHAIRQPRLPSGGEH
jgi:hypothetical protein